jgi:hypothetical protein
MASHFSLWHSDILRFKLAVLVLVAGLLAMHVLTPTSRADSYGVAAASLLVVWLGSNSPTERWLQAGTKRVRQLARAGTPVHEI